MRKTVALLYILLLACTTQAQNEARQAYYDSLTYADYLKADWKELQQHGQAAIKEKAASDWVYKRMGYALNVRHRYLNSAYYYNKVLHQNREDADALVMNYNNYLNTGNTAAMGVLNKWMTDDLRDYVGVRRKVLESVYVEGGAAISNNLAKNGAGRLFDMQHVLGAQNLTTGMYYWQAGFKLNAGKALSFYIAYNGLLLPHSEQYQYAYQKLVGTQPAMNNGQPYQRNIYQPADSLTEYKYYAQQQQLYINAGLALPYGWQLTPYLHGIFYGTTQTDFSMQPQFYYAQPIDSTQSTRPQLSYSSAKVSGADVALGLGLSKLYRNWLFELGGSYSSISRQGVGQATAAVTYYPLGNTWFSVTPRVTYVGFTSTNNLLYELSLTGRLHRYLWLTAYGTYGNLLYSNEKNGSIVYNATNSTKYRIGATLYAPVHKNVELFFNYQFRQMQGSLYRYVNETNYNSYNTTYQNHLLTLGLKFNL